MAPFGVDMRDCAWCRFGVADSARFGDVLRSLWGIGFIGQWGWKRPMGLGAPHKKRLSATDIWNAVA